MKLLREPLLFLSFFCCLLSLRADRLDEQIQLLLPDDGQNRATERQYVQRAIRSLISSLELEKITKKAPQKKVELIRERVVMNYLRSYVAGAELVDFFRKGEYDDISAAIVEAILFDHFAVPYFGVVQHWDARLLAVAKGMRETLSLPGEQPQTSTKQRAYKNDYVELLNLTVLPAQRPTSTEGVDSLFNRFHYAANEGLNFEQLAAYWHFQRAMHFYVQDDFLGAIRSLGIASQHEKRPAFAALEQATYLQLAQLDEENERQALFYFFELWNKDPDNKYLPNALLTHFVQSTTPLIEPGTDFGKGEQLYQFLESRGTDQPKWQNQLREIYYLQKSRYYGAQGRYDRVNAYIDSLYVMRPDHPVYRKVIGDLSIRAIRAEELSGDALQKRVNQLTTRYPFLVDSPRITDFMLESQAKAIRRLYDADEGYRADSQLAIFRAQAGQLPDNQQRAVWVLTVYVAASNYYFRMGHYQQARNLIQQGLQLNPTDDYLLHRQEVLSGY
ncbi:MAG: hypothetical protein AAF828_07330 [Bacteroidota bacterium]